MCGSKGLQSLVRELLHLKICKHCRGAEPHATAQEAVTAVLNRAMCHLWISGASSVTAGGCYRDGSCVSGGCWGAAAVEWGGYPYCYLDSEASASSEGV